MPNTQNTTANTLIAVIEYRDARTAKTYTGKVSITGYPSAKFESHELMLFDRYNKLDGYKAGTIPAGVGNLGTQLNQSGRALGQYGPTRTTQRANSAVYVDPVTKDVAIDYSGRELGMDPVQQRIQLLLSTVPGSIEHAPSMGFDKPGKLDSNVARELSVLVTAALKPLTDDGTIELVKVTAYYG